MVPFAGPGTASDGLAATTVAVSAWPLLLACVMASRHGFATANGLASAPSWPVFDTSPDRSTSAVTDATTSGSAAASAVPWPAGVVLGWGEGVLAALACGRSLR